MGSSFVCYALILGGEIDDIFYRTDFKSPLVDHIRQMSCLPLWAGGGSMHLKHPKE